MIKILLNGNEVVQFNGTMDLRIGQEVKVLGSKFYIKNIESTRSCVKVEIEEEQKCSLKIDGTRLATSVINTGHINTLGSKTSYGRNPFDK